MNPKEHQIRKRIKVIEKPMMMILKDCSMNPKMMTTRTDPSTTSMSYSVTHRTLMMTTTEMLCNIELLVWWKDNHPKGSNHYHTRWMVEP